MGVLAIQKNILGIEEFYQWIFVSIISAILFSFCDIYLFTKLFKVETTKLKIVKAIVADAICRIISVSIIPIPYYRALNLVFSVMIYKLIFNEKLERCILGEVINSITIIFFEVFFSKFFCELYPNIDTYASAMYDYKYKMSLTVSITIGRIILCHIIKTRNIIIDISKNLTKENKNRIIIISIIGCILIFFNAAEMTMFITDFPYCIFVLDILSLIVYFYISIKDIYRISTLEKMDEKINNLESYNKTLSIMYDNIRAFRHDFNNFVQALDGYVKTENIEGIKLMCSSVIKECKDVNSMGILDPKVINNPAVYSIITNKYYLAKEQNILINIEIMIDFTTLNIATYELCKILGILLDNAIEAASKCKEKIINVRFIKDFKVNRKIIIIENSYQKIDIDIEKIFEKGYSTKTDNTNSHGLGLWTVKKILCKSENLNLFTSKNDFFCQQLEIYEQ